MLCWNIALLLDVASHVTCFNQLEWFNLAKHGCVTLKFAYDISYLLASFVDWKVPLSLSLSLSLASFKSATFVLCQTGVSGVSSHHYDRRPISVTRWAIYWTLGNFSTPLATINLPKSIFVKIYHFSSDIICGQLLKTFGDFLRVTLRPTANGWICERRKIWRGVGIQSIHGFDPRSEPKLLVQNVPKDKNKTNIFIFS